MDEPHAEHSFYFDAAVLLDAMKISRSLDLSLDRLMSVAWEIGKSELFTKGRAFEQDDEAPESTPLSVRPVCPPVTLPAELALPDIAPEPAPLERSNDRRKLALMFPERALEEIRVLAVHADKSLSWCLGRAYTIARPKLAAARRR